MPLRFSYPFRPYCPPLVPEEEVERRSLQLYEQLNERRSVREFSSRPVPRSIIESLIKAAGTAPSGANKQPWMFCAVQNLSLKKQIRVAAEQEEIESYAHRMSAEWLEDLAPLGTDTHKEFLETAPWLLVVFRRVYEFRPDGSQHNNYYVSESVGLAVGFLLAAAHQAGLVALTHKPSPMNFLARLLNRPKNERPFLLIPIGYPVSDTLVPDIHRKPLDEISVWY
ncbi:nitroreductase family protein [Hymenobacter endophyticus]|uniref:Nitroreductase family protein n=1 Tax=Hymenobacter endophyticus TaxID=3076335 RepID=A0ABU3TCL4_9BACT|nr:nitroreductase family protein [Hymenobacter endophyticus]MDU0369080.1 nitroreductase family protein [Hymenobacter endophyticus]